MSKTQIFSNIMVGVDGSEASYHATKDGVSIAKKCNSNLTIVHVIVSDIGIFGPSLPTHIAALKEEAEQYLEDMKKEAVTENIQVQTQIIASASIVGGLVDYASKEESDLIVLGTKGKSSIKKLLLGSVASGMVTYAHCPVMVVR
jgi:nucleotide-binding universal stress UspA family protein